MEKSRADDPELKKQFGEQLAALKDRPFILETDAISAWAIICQIQLALRHPQNVGATADIARRTVERMIEVVAPAGTALREVAEMGWDKKFDI